MKLRHVFMGFALASLVTGCAMADSETTGEAQRGVKDFADIEIVDVGYGGTTVLPNGDKIIEPEFFVLWNSGNSTVNVGGFFLTDGNQWSGDGIIRLPQGTTIAAGDLLVVANYPQPTFFETYWGYRQVSYEEAYGEPADVEVGNLDTPVPNAVEVKSHIRLNHGGCDYDANCWDFEEPVWLLDSSLRDQEAIELVSSGDFGDHIVSSFPNP